MKRAVRRTVRKCYNPFEKVCDGTGPKTCKTFYETSCTTKYEEAATTSGKGNHTPKTEFQFPKNTFKSRKNAFKAPDSNSNNIPKINMGKRLLGVTKCDKIPVQLCGRGCKVVQRGEKCYDTEVDDLKNVPEERCELNPRQSCRNGSKLVPKLKPVMECSMVPKEFCALKYGPPRIVIRQQKSIWCLDETAD